MNMVGSIGIVNQGRVSTDLLKWVHLSVPRNVQIIDTRGNSIPRQRNMSVSGSLGGEWLLFLDSDIIPPLDLLPRILMHDALIVGGVALERFPPFKICAIESLNPPRRFEAEQLPHTGLLPAEALGTGCLLIRRPVFDRVSMPWFRCGQIRLDLLLEDTEFCVRAKREAGIQSYLDASLRVGHEFSGILSLGRDGRPWMRWTGSTFAAPIDLRNQTDPNALAGGATGWGNRNGKGLSSIPSTPRQEEV